MKGYLNIFWVLIALFWLITPILLTDSNEVVKFPIDLNKSVEENDFLIGIQSDNIEGQSVQTDSITGIKRKRTPKRLSNKNRKHSKQPILDEIGECLIHRPQCKHWETMNKSDKGKAHSKFTRYMMTPEQKENDMIRKSKSSRIWYYKKLSQMNPEELEERRIKGLESTKKYDMKKRLGLPLRTYTARTSYLKKNSLNPGAGI